MTPRPLVSTSSRRPLSAIFLGSLPPKEPRDLHIPDLPEPPESPGAVSTASGLPSPPATNSTGSGSTGDNNSANAGSTRQRPASYSGSIMSTQNNDNPPTVTSTSRLISDDEDDENDFANEEDNTARLDRQHTTKGSSENVVALQRVKNLAQRNRMALDKLSSRLNTPSPSNSSRASHSPLPPPSTSSASAASSTRRSTHSYSRSAPQPRHNDTLSGSETERESQRAPTPSYSNSHSYRSSSPELSTTPPPVPEPRVRLTSAPSSPGRMRQASPGPSRTPRKRVSIASAMSAPGGESARYSTNDHDVTEAALAAVASARRSPTGTGSGSRRPRQPLPREFRDNDRRSLEGRNYIEPVTPHRTSFRDGGNEDISPRTAAHTAANANSSLQYSPRGARSNRSSTVRDATRRHQTRWLSDDLSNNTPDTGRKQTQRGGSAESSLGGAAGATGRLAGEGLRAAGITMRGSVKLNAAANDDVFGDGHDAGMPVRRSRSSAAGSSAGRAERWEDEEQGRRVDVDERSRTSGSSARVSEGVGPPPSRPHLSSDPSRVPARLIVERDARGGRVISSRPATSMAEYFHGQDTGASRTGATSSRSRRQYDLPERVPPRDSPGMRPVSLRQATPESERPRTGTLTRRHTTMTPLSNGSATSLNNQQSEQHARLMFEALSMFQSNLSKLPNTQAVQGLSDQAASIIHTSDRLNGLLRAATANAVQQHIAMEIDDDYEGERGSNNDPARIWRDVGSDFRESLRESDEVVRLLTGFVLGVGKVLKETAAGAPATDGAHLRSMSLDNEVTRRYGRDEGAEGSGSRHSQDGRRAESRLSWEPMSSNGGVDLSRRLSARGQSSLARPPSVPRDRDDDRQTPSRNALIPPPSATRRLFTPREQREQQITSALAVHNKPSLAHDLSGEYEPSPTPASRFPQVDRQKPLSSFSTPPPLPSLPSESLLRKPPNATLDKSERRKVSIASITTVRAANAPFPLSTSGPTTAITPHTVSSPEASTLPLTRADSHDSVRSSVTFSRPSEVSVSTLQQHQHRDDARRNVTSSAVEEEPSIRSPLSGSETERDTRRRTIGARVARISLDGAIEEREGESGALQPRTITLPSQRRERRRTVTEIFG